MKKLIFFLFAASIMVFANSQQWEGFKSSNPAKTEVDVITSTSQTVSFNVSIAGIFTKDTVISGTNYRRIILPGGLSFNPEGSPELPVLKYKFAVPACSGIDVTWSVNSRQTLSSCLVYPVPVTIDQNGTKVEQFIFDPVAYTQQRSNDPVAAIYSNGAIREQKFAEVIVSPIEYCPVAQSLYVIDNVEVTLTFNNPVGDIRVPTGIFNKVVSGCLLNYEDDGTSALLNDKAFLRSGFIPGNIAEVRFSDSTEVVGIHADYIIICADIFFPVNQSPHPEVLRLAAHRSYYNGFDVAVFSVKDILEAGFYYEGNPNAQSPNEWDKFKKEQQIRTFIRTLYETGTSNNIGDGKCAYILLVGDVMPDNTMMPSSYDFDMPWGFVGPSDHYFTCVTKDNSGKYDQYADFYIGRISVQNETHLENVVEKTIRFETEYDFSKLNNSVGITLQNENIPNDDTYSVAFNQFYRDTLSNMGWNHSIAEWFELNKSTALLVEATIDYLNEGVIFSHLSFGHYFYESYILNSLVNNFKSPFVDSYSNLSGAFDFSDNGVNCFGENLVMNSPDRGAVCFIGYSTTFNWDNRQYFETENLMYQECYPYFLLVENTSIVAELMMRAKNEYTIYQVYDIIYKYSSNLLGDPALNIMAEGYKITDNVTVDCNSVVTCKIFVCNNATVSVSNGCSLDFVRNGQLIIEPDGNLIIEDGSQINGSGYQINEIYVNGGGISIGSNVVFNNMKGGLSLGNDDYLPGPPLFNENIQYNLNNVTFNNSPLSHNSSRLSVSNCTFNSGSNVFSSNSFIFLDICTFNNTEFISMQTGFSSINPSSYPNTTVKNSSFIYDNGSPSFPCSNTSKAIQIYNSNNIYIQGNTISGYLKGITLNSSGTTISFPQGKYSDVIYSNNISYCGTGIELYNSIADFKRNIIFNNNFGVKLFNNSYTMFYNNINPVSTPQIIYDNVSFELFASECSFPIIFRCNQVIDEDNLGNKFEDPLVYWDLEKNLLMMAELNYNYWGINFEPEEDLYPHKNFLLNYIWYPESLYGCLYDSKTDELIYQSGLDYFSENDYYNAELTFKELIEEYPNSQFAIAAMQELFAIEQFTNNNFTNLRNYYASFTPADSTLFNIADFLATRCNVAERQWQPAIDWYEDRIANPPSYPDSVFAVIDLGDIHLRMEADTAGVQLKSRPNYSYRFSEIKPRSKAEFEINKATLLATLPQKQKPQTQQPIACDKKGQLMQNIPNPAAETTTIVYELFAEGIADIKIFNVLGQQVINIPLSKKRKGTYQTVVSLEKMPNGIYEYALYVDNVKVDAKKMVVSR